MRIIIKTEVGQSAKQVFAGFNRELFLKLNPPFPPVRLLQFDGCQREDWVKLELNFIFFKQTWESLITESEESEQEIYFVDEGKKLPFFLKFWRHRHRIVTANDKSSYIIDDIEYRAPFTLLTYLLYPVLYLQFLYRKPIYRRVFKS